MHKIKKLALTAGRVFFFFFKIDFKEAVERFVTGDNAFSFISSVQGTAAYWKQFLYDVLAMVKQSGIPTYFLTLSCADLRWEESPYVINKLNNLSKKKV